MFELSSYTAVMFCINCQHEDFVLTTIEGKQFHVYYQSFNRKAKPVECFGPFAYSMPPTVAELDYVAFMNIQENVYHEAGEAVMRGFILSLYASYIDSLAALASSDNCFPSIEEILWDNIHHGDVSLYMQ